MVGRYCSLAAEAVLMTGGEHHATTVSTWAFENFLDHRPNPTRTYRQIRDTVIGSDVWIGRGAQIEHGAMVGDGAVVGAGSVVTRDVPPYAIVAENPAWVIRMRFDETTVSELIGIAWWNWSPETIFERRSAFYEPLAAFIEHFG